MNKKGLGSELKDIIYYSVIIVVCVIIIWAYLLHGAGDNLNTLQTCSSVGVGKGVCRESCNSDIEASFVGLGCSGVKNTCCISTSTSFQDTMLPAQDGGNTDYNFVVNYGGVFRNEIYEKSAADMQTNVGKCRFTDSPADLVLVCTPNTPVTVVIKTKVTNTGANDIKNVIASPVVILDGDSNVRQSYAGPSTPLPKDGSLEIQSNPIIISAKDAAPDSVWKIFPYATCTDPECVRTSADGKGIIKNFNNGQGYISIQFRN